MKSRCISHHEKLCSILQSVTMFILHSKFRELHDSLENFTTEHYDKKQYFYQMEIIIDGQ
jgi:hypothetical protein